MKNKLFLTLLLVLMLPAMVFSEPYTVLKTGIVKMQSGAKVGYLIEGEMGYQWNKHSLGLSFGQWRSRVASGSLVVNPLLLQYKYDLTDKLSLGAGGGLAFVDFKEDYDGKAKADSRKIVAPMVEYRIGKDWSISARYIIGDLKIESGCVEQGVLEDGSRLDSVQVMVSWKF